MHVTRRLRQFLRHQTFALGQAAKGLVSFQLRQITTRVITDTSDQFDGIGQFDEVIVGSQGEGLRLDDGFFLGGQDDHGNLACGLVDAEKLDQCQPIDIGHDQILQNDRRMHGVGRVDGAGGIGTEVENDVAFLGEHAPDGFPNDRLIVHEQDGDGTAVRVVLLGSDAHSKYLCESHHAGGEKRRATSCPRSSKEDARLRNPWEQDGDPGTHRTPISPHPPLWAISAYYSAKIAR